MCRIYDGILICCSWRRNSAGGTSFGALLFPLHKKALPPHVKSNCISFSFVCISLHPGIYWIGDWKSCGLYLVWGFLAFLWNGAVFFSTQITQFYISAKHCRLCSVKQKNFLICSSSHTPIPLQEWFLFWKGTMTSFCKVGIRNFPEVLPLPKAQACSALQFLPWKTEDVLSSLSVWLGWRLVAFLRSFTHCPYSHSAPTVSKIKEPLWEQIMELAWLFLWGFLMAEWTWASGQCVLGAATSRFGWSVALVLTKRH